MTDAPAEVCKMNIGPRERRKRLRIGVATFSLSVAALGVLIATGTSQNARLVLFVPFLVAATGYFQARDNTCVALAARGMRDLDGGAQKIDDAAELEQVQRQAKRVNLKSLVAAVVLTGLGFALPF